MSGKFFLDTNIFIYSFDEKNKFKRQASKSLIQNALKFQNGIISFQVIQEFLNIATKKLPVVLSLEELRDYLQIVLVPLCDVYPTHELYKYALELHKINQIPFYDSLILAAAIQTGCVLLYTEDLQHGRVISGVKIQNPFV